MSNTATQLEKALTTFKDAPSQETLVRLYKRAKRANLRVLVTWWPDDGDDGDEDYEDYEPLRELIDVATTKPYLFEPDPGFDSHPPMGTIYLKFDFNVPSCQWWYFDEIEYRVKAYTAQ